MNSRQQHNNRQAAKVCFTFSAPLTSESEYGAAARPAPLLLAAATLPFSTARSAPTMAPRTSRRSGSTCAWRSCLPAGVR